MPPKKRGSKAPDTSTAEKALTRIAIIKAEKCKPKKCHQECKKSCPVVKLGKLCIEVGPKSKLAYLSEPLCIGESEPVSIIYVLLFRPFRPQTIGIFKDCPFCTSSNIS